MNLEKISIRFNSINYNTVNLNLKTREVTAQTNRLRVTWTPELAEDLKAFLWY